MSSIDFSTLTQKIAALLAAHPEQPVLIALDGRCGSGKTTLAGQLAEQFPASIVFHTDDYYLPPAQRIPEWEKTPCANMDLARLREELLRPARAGEPVFYRAYSCREGAYRPGQCIPAQRPPSRPSASKRGRASATPASPHGGSRWKRGISRNTASRKKRILCSIRPGIVKFLQICFLLPCNPCQFMV